MHDQLRARFLRIITLGLLPAALSACGVDGSGGGGGSTGGQSTGGGGSTSSHCVTDEVGTCCYWPTCLTPEELAALTGSQGGMGGTGGTGGTGGMGGTGGTGGMGGMGGTGGGFMCPSGNALPSDLCFGYAGNPVFENGKCCYEYWDGDCCGRPFVVGSEQRIAAVVGRADWRGPATEPVALDAAFKHRLSQEWLGDALLEHASIAAFCRFTLQLLELGAPRELIAASQRASLDEQAHAEACFALANRFADEPIGPGALEIRGALSGRSLADVAALVVIEACVGETVAAALAQEQLAVTSDPQALAALERIAKDEAEHAELGWGFVTWALREGGRPVSDAVAAAFESALRSRAAVPTDFDSDAGQRSALHRFGRLTSSERSAARQRALDSVVRPCSQRLLALASRDVVNQHLTRAEEAV